MNSEMFPDGNRSAKQSEFSDAVRDAADVGFGYGKSDLYQQTGRLLVILNGGAIVVLIGFLGNFSSNQKILSLLAINLKIPFIMYSVAAVGAAILPSGIAEYYMAHKSWQKTVNYYWSYLLVFGPGVLFLIASWYVIDVIAATLKDL